MGINLSGLVEALGAGAAGYGRGVQIRKMNERIDRAEERQAKQDARADTLAQREDAAYQEAQALKDGIRGAMADQVVTDQQDTSLPLPMQVPKYGANGQSYDTEEAAQAALAGQNSLSAKHARAAKVASSMGAADHAAKFRALADTYHKEGAGQVLDAIEAGAPGFDALAKGPVRTGLPKQALEAFNSVGSMRLDPNSQVEYVQAKDAAGRPTVAARVIDGRGNVILSDTRAARLMLMDAAQREQAEQREMQIGLDYLSKSETSRHNKAMEEGQEKERAERRADRETAKREAREERARNPINEKIRQEEEARKKPYTEAERAERVEFYIGGGKEDADIKDWRAIEKEVRNTVAAAVEAGTPVNEAIAQGEQLRAHYGNQIAQRTVSRELAKASGTDQYAKVYGEAVQAGFSAEQLNQMGYPAPGAKPQAKPAAAAQRAPGTGAQRAAAGTMSAPAPAKAQGGWQNNAANPSPYAREQEAEAAAERAAEQKRRQQDIAVLQRRIALLEKDAATPRNRAQLAADRKQLAALQAG